MSAMYETFEQIIEDRNRLKRLIVDHNEACQKNCGVGDQEAVSCKYRPYFEKTGRRCPECPTDYQILDELGNVIL